MSNNPEPDICQPKPVYNRHRETRVLPIRNGIAGTTGLLVAGDLPVSGLTVPREKEFNILDYGARADGKTLNTTAIQAAIDRCAGNGGGRVRVPRGTFLTGGFRLKSGVEFHLEKGAVILGSPHMKDYEPHPLLSECRYQKYLRYALVFAQGAENISVTGTGTLNGNGQKAGELGEIIGKGSTAGDRPCLLWFDECSHILVKDITFTNSCMWTETYSRCRNVHVDHITVRENWFFNADGCNMVDCENFIIENCEINTMDDGICLKGYTSEGCRNGIIRNNRVRSICNGIKMGTDSSGGFRDILIEDNEIWQTTIAGLALEMVDGGVLERVEVRNLRMDVVGTPVFIIMSNRHRPVTEALTVPNGRIRDVTISNLEATVDRAEKYNDLERAHFNFIPYASSITGYPGNYVENIRMENISIHVRGGFPQRSAADALREVPEAGGKYPTSRMFGVLPAWGCFIRHVKGLEMRNVKIDIAREDGRPGIMLDDVHDSGFDDMITVGITPSPAISVKNNCSGICFDSSTNPEDQ